MEHTSEDPNPQWVREKERIKTLSWWKELAGQPGIAADGVAWHFQPHGLLQNFHSKVSKLIWLGRVRELYGMRVSEGFRERMLALGENLSLDPNYVMACIALETGRTFNPAIKNPNSSATGLIQFMSSTAADLGTTTALLAK
ncbi:hypothetical protein [Pseudomonas sp. AA-38]|uniref:hypothetical protein n=1 Tax=Pseudomonas sp. AA-38 TaxID=3028807 RepID=UPI0023F94659|nr:hypothetical protein [Pseudomonas sp. AA-38]